VLDKLTGRLVACADSQALAEAMLHLLGHPAEAARMARVGREHVMPLFDARTMVRRIEQLYQGCLTDKRAADPDGQPCWAGLTRERKLQ
jgi:glycosyltransferase involved in cell wall biosynthesis